MFIYFLRNHYELIISCFLLLVSVLMALFKKKPSYNEIDEIKNYILTVLPGLILKVESPGHGEDKKSLVVASLKLLLIQTFGFKDFDKLELFVDNAIESILATPQKK